MAENVMKKGITMMIMVMLVVTQVCEATQSSTDVNNVDQHCDPCRAGCAKACGDPTEPLLICYKYCLHMNCPDCPCLVCSEPREPFA
jgi:hypothetical protein